VITPYCVLATSVGISLFLSLVGRVMRIERGRME
jgi:hypothetical protein